MQKDVDVNASSCSAMSNALTTLEATHVAWWQVKSVRCTATCVVMTLISGMETGHKCCYSTYLELGRASISRTRSLPCPKCLRGRNAGSALQDQRNQFIQKGMGPSLPNVSVLAQSGHFQI